jgi:hypothetical protein
MKIGSYEAKAKMPELLVFAKVFIIGIIGAEVFRIAFYLGEAAKPLFSFNAYWCDEASLFFITSIICCLYAHKRNAGLTIELLAQSRRIDLFSILIIGVCSNFFLEPLLSNVHKLVQQSNPWFGPFILITILVMFASSVWRVYSMEVQEKNRARKQLLFLEDEAIDRQDQDKLSGNDQAVAFAQTVLESANAHSGLVFGIDGPWGVGKTSFINLAQKYWESKAKGELIVFRFEPLRYASELDLSQRFIKELATTIQKQVYAPEFQSLASRYSRMLKGKAGFSFLGFKLSLEPSNETIDEMLHDIDEVLKRAGRRLVVVVDDLDRLEPKLVNNVLFTVRRTFNLSQASYILCYDLENLLLGKDDGEKAREFLEKFVMIQHSLFIDRASIKNYLSKNWKNEQVTQLTTSSESILKLSSVLTTLVAMLEGNKAAEYMPIIGNLRKVKRFVNTLLLLQIETIDLDKTDFCRYSLINLLLLHLHYPGVFRRIYSEETDGHTGIFSDFNKPFKTDDINEASSHPFNQYLEKQETSAKFLLCQLFIEEKKELYTEPDDSKAILSNVGSDRNLEKYLKLIVRLAIPEPRYTYILYWRAVERVKVNKDAHVSAIEKELKGAEFSLKLGEHAHNKFWSILVNQSHDFTDIVAEDAINTLIELLPQYSLVAREDMYMGQRSSSIYSLTRLLDSAGWGRTNAQRLSNSRENVVEVAHRIFGKNVHEGNGIIARLASQERGTLVWEDLLTFRLSCSAERGGQLHNLYSALVLFEDSDARTDGLVSELARKGMRKLSQEISAFFKARYIDTRRNFLSEIDDTPSKDFLGEAEHYFAEREEDASNQQMDSLEYKIDSARSALKIFVTYQLCNATPPERGVGCGFYDESGSEDLGGIAKIMNDYFFDVCFNPNINENNIFHFVNHCLMNLTRTHGREYEDSYQPTENGLAVGFDISTMKQYWREHGEFIKSKRLEDQVAKVITYNYIATYKEDLPVVFKMLDGMLKPDTDSIPNAS